MSDGKGKSKEGKEEGKSKGSKGSKSYKVSYQGKTSTTGLSGSYTDNFWFDDGWSCDEGLLTGARLDGMKVGNT